MKREVEGGWAIIIDKSSFRIMQLMPTHGHLQQWTDLYPCWFQAFEQLREHRQKSSFPP